MIPELDISRSRRHQYYSRSQLLERIIWWLIWPLFRLSPRPLFLWRRALLCLLGSRLKRGVHIYPSVDILLPSNLDIDEFSSIGPGVRLYNPGRISIGRSVTISQGAHLCAATHDYMAADFPLLEAPITIAPSVWVCADAFIGPHVALGEGAVVGARAVVMGSVEPWNIVVGNPSRCIGKRTLKNG